MFCSLLQTSGLLVGAIGSQVPREPCQAAMLSPVSFWKASGLEVGDFGPVGPVRTRFGDGLRTAHTSEAALIREGVQKHAGGAWATMLSPVSC